MYLYFIRHGESEANVLHEFSNGLNKHPLTVRGRQQALVLAEKMKEIPLTYIYSSPILRARQTAEILTEPHGITVKIADALREFDVGSFEGRTDDESWKAFDKVNDDWLRGLNHHIPISGGESFLDIKNRFLPFIHSLQRENTRNPDAHIALVGHGGTYRLMLPLVLNNITPLDAISRKIGNTVIIKAESKGDELRCIQWGDEEIK